MSHSALLGGTGCRKRIWLLAARGGMYSVMLFLVAVGVLGPSLRVVGFGIGIAVESRWILLVDSTCCVWRDADAGLSGGCIESARGRFAELTISGSAFDSGSRCLVVRKRGLRLFQSSST